VIIGGKTQAEVETILNALASSLGKHPAGSLRLTFSVHRIGDPTMDFLGYRFRRRSQHYGGYGRAGPSDRSVKGFHRRLAYRLLLGVGDWEWFIEHQCARWVRSFPMWSNRLACEDLAVLHVQCDLEMPVWRLRHSAVQNRVRWRSFAAFRDALQQAAFALATGAPRMFTEGGGSQQVRRENQLVFLRGQ
jgi:hypothetical protein